MNVLRRCATRLGVVVATAGLLVATAGLAHADTAYGKSCGEKHPMAPEYYDAFGNAAPCTADFVAGGPTTARITIDVIQLNGIERDDDHIWKLDVDTCEGSVRPSEPPRVFTCQVAPGPHTVFVAKSIGDARIDLRVDY